MREARNAQAVDLFRYKVSLKNTGLKMIKSISWDFQGSYTEDFADTTHRQFRCTAKLKPNSSERFEGHSILPPVRVISASNKTFIQRVVINRIEYDDGTFWQRSEWRAPQEPATSPAAVTASRFNCLDHKEAQKAQRVSAFCSFLWPRILREWTHPIR